MVCLIYARRGLVVFLAWALLLLRVSAQSPQDAGWPSNADIEDSRTLTIEGLGAIQGVSFHDGKVYLYGDVGTAKPRVGVIREYSRQYEPTGRVIWLRKNDQPLLRHPTGLTWSRQWGTFLGDTVEQKGVIYRLDWERALVDGNLDHSVLDIIDDDAAVNGCRPEFVTVRGKEFLATADYGDVRPEVRLYDPANLLKHERSSAPGVIAARFLCGAFNQNLYWDADREQLMCIQNVIAGRGWRLDIIDLANALGDGRATGPNVRVRTLTFLARNELEGYRPLAGELGLFVTSSQKDNLTVGTIKIVDPIQSKAEH